MQMAQVGAFSKPKTSCNCTWPGKISQRSGMITGWEKNLWTSFIPVLINPQPMSGDNYNLVQGFGISQEDFFKKIELIVEEKLKEQLHHLQFGLPKGDLLYLKRKEVVKILDVSLQTIYNWERKGLLKSYKIGGKVFYKRDDLAKAIEFKNSTPATRRTDKR